MFKTIDEHDIAYFTQVISPTYVLAENAALASYNHDETEDLRFNPDVVLIPKTTEEVASIMRYCNEKNIAVTPRGAGTGLAGGALAIYGGVCLSMERFDDIQIDKDNYQVTVEPGVICENLQDTLKAEGLFYPVDPASKGSSFIGGNISTGAGGPRAVKYGTVIDYVLNLEVVLPNGDIIWTGANTLKNSTGYNITQLLVGSEGTLGIITKIVLRLLPHPTHNLLILVPFRKVDEATDAVSAIFKVGVTPSALEFMERTAVEWALAYVGDSIITLGDDIAAHLLIEVDGFDQEQLYGELGKINEVLAQYDTDEILFADNESQKKQLWHLRRNVSHAVKSKSVYKEEDTVVPRHALTTLLSGVKAIGSTYGFDSVCYGHAGDGNLHVNIIKGDLSDTDWDVTVTEGIRSIFELVKRLGGTLSGEHGIGYVQRPYLNIVQSPALIQLEMNIKSVFDPNNILNPGKIFLTDVHN